MPGTVLSAKAAAMNKTESLPTFQDRGWGERQMTSRQIYGLSGGGINKFYEETRAE